MRNRKLLKTLFIISLILAVVLVFLYVKKHGDTKKQTLTEESEPVEEPDKIEGSDLAEESDLIKQLDVIEKQEQVKKPEPEETKEPETLHYIDAWEEWHDMTINPNVRKHNYNYEFLNNERENISYEDENYTIRKGVDVSHHQGHIDWQKVYDAGYEFAILRIGYRGYGKGGSLNKDKRFDENIVNAQNVGMDVGVYIFAQAINEEEALEEAEAVIKWLDGYELQLPVVYDPELIRDDEARTDDVSGEQFTKNTIAFCERIKEAGYTPMIYSNMVWEDELFDMEALQDYMFWYADYELIPQTPYDYVFWQLYEKGSVPGIAGGVDLDIEFIER